MSRRPRIITGAALVACALAAATAGPATAASDKKVRKVATNVLAGSVWTTYASGEYSGASQDRTTHLCRNGTFVVFTSFTVSGIDDPSSYDHPYGESRITGRWRVVKARLNRDRTRGEVLVRYVTDDGQRGTVVFAAGSRGPTMGGAPAEVGRSSVC